MLVATLDFGYSLFGSMLFIWIILHWKEPLVFKFILFIFWQNDKVWICVTCWCNFVPFILQSVNKVHLSLNFNIFVILNLISGSDWLKSGTEDVLLIIFEKINHNTILNNLSFVYLFLWYCIILQLEVRVDQNRAYICLTLIY